MSDEIMLVLGEDGVAREYDDTWDITIHCESEEEQKAVLEKLNNSNQETKHSKESSSTHKALDTISRREAIDALKEHRSIFCDNTPDTFSRLPYGEKCRVDEIDTSIATLLNLPSAQPEIIRCKDCKHMIINEKHENKPMICCLTKMCGTTAPDWFCADGERRTNE